MLPYYKRTKDRESYTLIVFRVLKTYLRLTPFELATYVTDTIIQVFQCSHVRTIAVENLCEHVICKQLQTLRQKTFLIKHWKKNIYQKLFYKAPTFWTIIPNDIGLRGVFSETLNYAFISTHVSFELRATDSMMFWETLCFAVISCLLLRLATTLNIIRLIKSVKYYINYHISKFIYVSYINR